MLCPTGIPLILITVAARRGDTSGNWFGILSYFDHRFTSQAHLVNQCLEDWPHFVETYADAVFLGLGEMLDVNIEQTFGRFGNLKESVSNVVNELLNELQENAAKHLQWLLALENYPFTLNTHYVESYHEKLLKNDQLAEAASPEIVLMAGVRAYFQVAYKRIIDNVPRAIDYDGVITLSTRVNDALEYFAEDPEVSNLCAELQAKQKRLEEITTRLSGFSRKSNPRWVSVARSSFRLDASSPLSPFQAMIPPNSRPSSRLTVYNGSITEEKDDPSPQSTAVSFEPQDSEEADALSPAPPAIDPEEIYLNLDTIFGQIDLNGFPVLWTVVGAAVQKFITTAAWAKMGASICEKLKTKVDDCFIVIAIDRLHRGLVPDDVFALRFRLLSLYIVKEDMMTLGYEGDLQYRYPAIISLLVLREKTLLAGRTEHIIHLQTWAIEVRGHYALCA
ncbi:hypothetical protein BDZ89DRAFT_1161318 [Hymenopellis radicata]|nr:hypothetical protein BDZ89DRAFT_1161318 [Hymenopellis radicata]